MALDGRASSIRSTPEQIGRYRILERIGKGAMGVVYSARDEALDRLVAVKIMMADLEGEPETRERFYREARVSGQLTHRNIITVFDVGEEQGRVYIVMELLEGVTLGEYLKKPEAAHLERKLDLMSQMTEGLGAAHARGVCHRDVKPGNLMVQEDGTLKVLDFGVARLSTSTMTASGFIVGTPDYMSPEQAKGKEVDPRSDIFSAGAVFYYMLTGQKPFAAPDLPAVLRRVQSDNPRPIEEASAPADVARVALKALAKDPQERYQTCRDLLGDLLRVKRAYDVESRRLAGLARDAWVLGDSLRREILELYAWHGAPPVDPIADDLDAKLADEYPVFADQGAEALALIPFPRLRVTEILSMLHARCDRLTSDVSPMRLAKSAAEHGARLLAEGDLRRAAAQLETATSSFPQSARANDALAECRRRLAERRDAEERVKTILADARAAAAALNWAAVEALSNEALDLTPDSTAAQDLRRRAHDAIAREAEQRVRVHRLALERAERAIDAGRFDEALACLAQAADAGAGPDALAALTSKLESAQSARAAADLLAARANDAIVRARAAFEAGGVADAIADLRSHLAEAPDAPGVALEIQRMIAEDERRRAAEQRAIDERARSFQQAVDRAQLAIDAARLPDAEHALVLAREIDGASPVLERLARRIDDLRSAQAAADALARETAAVIARVRVVFDEGRREAALSDLRDFAVQSPQAPGVAGELARLSAEHDRLVEAARREAQDRARAFLQLLDRARRAIEAGRFDEVDGLLNQARPLGSAAEVETVAGERDRARQARAEADALAQRAADVVAQARVLFSTGSHDAALEQLRDFARETPGVRAIDYELQRMTDELARIAAAAQRAAALAEAVQEADAALVSEQWTDAVRFAEAALVIDPRQARASQIRAVAHARLHDAAAAEARRHEADAHAERAVELLRRGAPDKALREARRALELAPDHARAMAAVGEVQRREAESRQAREHARVRREQFKAAMPHVETARRAIDAGDFTRGAWACEQALALAPDHPEAFELRERAREMAAQDRERRLASDDTVNVGAEPDDDATNVGAPAPTQGSSMKAKVSAWAGALLRRGKSQGGQTTTEYLMIAGILTVIAVFLIGIMPRAVRTYALNLIWDVRTIAP